MEPIMKWAGGKRQLIPALERYFDREALFEGRNRYFEPFIGGGALFFYIEPHNAVINDFNPELINVYEVIRDSPRDLIEILRLHQANYTHDYYIHIRSMDRRAGFNDLPQVERAARIIFLNKTCYNGLYRVNNNGYFNVPIGQQDNPDIVMADKIYAMSNYFNNNDIVLRRGDFEAAVFDAQPGDVIYFDPPYDYEKTGFTSYNQNTFGRNDLERLKQLSDNLVDIGCTVILSNNDTPFVNELFREYAIEHIDAKRFINCDGTKRRNGKEVIIYGNRQL